MHYIKISNRVIAFITSIFCFFLIFRYPLDIRFTNAPKLVFSEEIESTNDRKKVKC